MQAAERTAFWRGLGASLPVAAGYLPVAFSFGVAALQAGLQPSLVLLMSALLFAGGAQFVMIGLLAAGGGLFTVLPTVMLMNARHLLYGGPVLAMLPPATRRPPSVCLAFGLTDEVFATALGRLPAVPPADRAHWFAGLQLGAYAGWVGGTAMGLVAGAQVAQHWPLLAGMLAFVLPALFLALLLGMKRPWWPPALAAAATTALLQAWWPAYLVVPVAMVLSAAAGAAVKHAGARHGLA